MNVRIFEVFTSVEGEGILYGTKTLFVRLAGCPFKCFYCDTKNSLPMDSGKEYSLNDACDLIEKNLEKNTYKVNFTGGDPLVQHKGVIEMAKFVRSKKIPTYIESSCYDSHKFAEILPFFDFIKIEFKTPDSEFVDLPHYPNLLENELQCLLDSLNSNKKTFIKIVISSKTEIETFKQLISRVFDIVSINHIAGFIIQPSYGISEPSLKKLLDFYDIVYPYYAEVRIIPQLHKIIGAP